MWPLPEQLYKPDGAPRCIGVEIELQGLTVARIAQLISEELGGSVEQLTVAEYAVDVPALGRFMIEVDFALLKQLARQQTDQLEKKALDNLAVDLLEAASSLVVPCEIVCPPIPMDKAGEPMDQLTEALRDAGAKGTRASLMYAFGLHLNVEPPDLDARTLLRYLQAYVCLHDWIVWEDHVDISRRLSPYIQPYSSEYQDRITSPEYSPELDELIRDYLTLESSRNRALDMLPLFAFIDEQSVAAAVGTELVNARPTFHYRLANCCVDEPAWTVETPWRHWLEVESLAGRPRDLRDCMAAFREDRKRLLTAVDPRWRFEIEKWLSDAAQ
ncbi:MAG: amidoligase family protein [Pseudomonadota bacterium]